MVIKGQTLFGVKHKTRKEKRECDDVTKETSTFLDSHMYKGK
jgi:hypothetical protein